MDKDELKATLSDLNSQLKTKNEYNLNFFRAMEAESKEQESMKKQLKVMVDAYRETWQRSGRQFYGEQPAEQTMSQYGSSRPKEPVVKQSLADFTRFLRRKNILEAKLFKKKYERVAKHISGIPKGGKHLNPFEKQAPVSVFSEQMHDPKMNIPQNRVLFDDVIKFAVPDLEPDE